MIHPAHDCSAFFEHMMTARYWDGPWALESLRLTCCILIFFLAVLFTYLWPNQQNFLPVLFLLLAFLGPCHDDDLPTIQLCNWYFHTCLYSSSVHRFVLSCRRHYNIPAPVHHTEELVLAAAKSHNPKYYLFQSCDVNFLSSPFPITFVLQIFIANGSQFHRVSYHLATPYHF